MNLFELVARITLDEKEYTRGIDEADKKGKGFAKSFRGGLATVGKAFAGFGAAAVGGAMAINGLIDSTEEYRVAAGKLSTAFESAGMSQETANKAYSDFYAIIGDTDTATEAAQLLSHLAKSEEDVAEWSRIAAGVAGQFGDSIPLEALIESSNEVSKTGELVGSLSDALLWAGVSEDEFNAQLSELSTEEERNQLITETLTGIYGEAGDAFAENNKAIIEQRKNQALLDEATGNLGDAFLSVRNRIEGYFLPGLVDASEVIAGLVSGDGSVVTMAEQGIISFGDKVEEFVPRMGDLAVSMIERFVQLFNDNWGQFYTLGLEVIGKLAVGIIKAAPKIAIAAGKAILQMLVGIAKATPQILMQVVKMVADIGQAIIDARGEIVEAGKQLIAGLWQGIKDRAGWIGDKVAGFINGIKARFTGKDGFDIHSPSKWAAEVGYRIPEGMAIGFAEGAPLAIGAAEMLVDSVQGSIEQKIQAAAGKTITERLLEAAGAPLTEEEIQKKMFFARGRKSNVEEQRLDRERERRREKEAQRQVQLDQIARERESRMRDRKNLNAFTGEKFKTTVVRSQNQPPANVVRMPEYRPEPQVIQVTLELDGEVLARKMVKYNENETIRRGVPLLGGA